MLNEIEIKVRKILEGISDTDVRLDQIGLEESFSELGINSANFIKIVMGIENEFGIEFDNNCLIIERFEDLNSLILYIRSKVI
jgi:acyl carrier protein